MNPFMSAPFQKEGPTATVATTTSSSVATALGRTGHEQTVVVNNVSATAAAIAFGTSSAMSDAAATDSIIPPNQKRIFRIGPTITHFKGIALSGTGVLYVEVGEGSVT